MVFAVVGHFVIQEGRKFHMNNDGWEALLLQAKDVY